MILNQKCPVLARPQYSIEKSAAGISLFIQHVGFARSRIHNQSDREREIAFPSEVLNTLNAAICFLVQKILFVP